MCSCRRKFNILWTKIAIKYADKKYSFDLNHLLVEEGYAPILHSTHLLKSKYLCMLMDWVDEGLDDLKESERQEIAKHLVEILTLIRQKGFVHGDRRNRNIIVCADLKPMIIDYDWTGSNQKVCYPSNVDYDQFQLLPSEECSGIKTKFPDDDEAIKFYIKYCLAMSNDVVISLILKFCN